MNFQKISVAAVVLLFTIGSFAVTGRDGITKRVRFAKGKSSVTLSNSVVRGDQDTYIVGARAGQRITVTVAALEDNAVFQIEAPDGPFLGGAGEMDDAAKFSTRLPESGDYRIIVGGTRGNASYKLTIAIR